MLNALRDSRAKIFITVFLVYLFYIGPGFLQAGTMRYIILTKAIVDDHTFNIDKYHNKTIDISFYKDHYYIGAAPGLSFMAVPLYMAAKPFLKLISEGFYINEEFGILNFLFAFFLAVLPGSIIAFLVYDMLKGFGLVEKEKLLLVFTSSFGTLLFFYSTKFLAHTMSAFLLFFAFYILHKAKNEYMAWGWFFLAGMLMGLAVLTEYISVIGSALLLLYFLIDFKKHGAKNIFVLIFGSILLALLFMYYHYECFGHPLRCAFGMGGKFRGSSGLGLPRLKVMHELTFGVYRGIFIYMPVLLFSVYGIYLFFKKPANKFLKEMIFIASYAILFFLVISGYAAWDMGGAFGPRYFVCIMPFLAIPMAFSFKKLNYKIIFWVAILSTFINWCGVQYGDADSVFTNMGLFIFGGLNSNFAEWAYRLTNDHIRKLNVITHFSPFIGFVALLGVIYLIWKEKTGKLGYAKQ